MVLLAVPAILVAGVSTWALVGPRTALEPVRPGGGTGPDGTWTLPPIRWSWRTGTGGLVGAVRDVATGRPPPGLALRLVGTGFGGEAVERALPLDAAGEFGVGDVPAGGSYELRVGVEPQPLAVGLVVADRGVTDVGVLWHGPREGVRGVITRAGGAVVAGARVGLYRPRPSVQRLEEAGILDAPAGMMPVHVPLATATTDERGAFRIDGVPPGIFTVTVQAAACATGTRSVAAGLGLASLELQAGRGITGELRDGDGSPVARALVGWDGRLQRESEGSEDRTLTDGEGRFALFPSEHSEDALVVVPPSGIPFTVRPTEVEQDHPVRLVLPAPRSLEVTVVREEDGTPLANARVVAGCAYPMPHVQDAALSGASVFTDRAGKAVLQLPRTEIEVLLVQHPDTGPRIWWNGKRLLPQSLRVPDPAPEATRLELRLPAGHALRGVVVDEAGRPLAGVAVSALSLFGEPLGGAVTDGSGRFALHTGEEVEGRNRIFLAARRRGWVQTNELEGLRLRWPAVEPSGDFRIVLRPAARIAGRVVDERGVPVGRAVVAAEGEDRPFPVLNPLRKISVGVPTLTADTGEFELVGPFPGIVRLAVRRPGSRGADMLVRPPETGTLRVEDVVLKAGAASAPGGR
jgi:hypothetical protein